MIQVSVTVDDAGVRSLLVDIGELETDRRALNQVLSERLAEELQAHFRAKNATPNRLGGKRTNFWSSAANNTAVSDVTEEHGVVSIGGESGQNIRVHLFGGTIRPIKGKYLTIPLVGEAHGLRVAEYEQRTGRELFRPGDANVLVEKTASGGDRSSLFGGGGVRVRDGKKTTIPVARKQELRAVYALAKEAKIKKDPDVLPADDVLVAALTEEGEDWLEGGVG